MFDSNQHIFLQEYIYLRIFTVRSYIIDIICKVDLPQNISILFNSIYIQLHTLYLHIYYLNNQKQE
jgi:hypothetical protein